MLILYDVAKWRKDKVLFSEKQPGAASRAAWMLYFRRVITYRCMSLRTGFGQFLAFIGRSLTWSFHIGVFFYTLLIYYLLARLPLEHWLASMIMITLPIAWLLLLLLGVFWAFTRPWRSLLSVIGLLLGYWLYPRTFSVHTADAPPEGVKAFSVLSYNVSGFGLEAYPQDRQGRVSGRVKLFTEWVLKHPAGIKCFQEFYAGDQDSTYRMVDRLAQAGYPYYAFLNPRQSGSIGVATFSRYPILNEGKYAFSSFNGMLWTDIKVNNDTIRVINVHLQSMGIRVRRVLTKKEMADVKAETRTVLGALKVGFTARQHEVRLVEEQIAQSPYPVIVTGDFNDTPYSVVYERLRRQLPNAFENAGHGFGFTLNRAPKTIRIDNQFYDPRLQVLDFETHHDIPYSDHYPVEGKYVVGR